MKQLPTWCEDIPPEERSPEVEAIKSQIAAALREGLNAPLHQSSTEDINYMERRITEGLGVPPAFLDTNNPYSTTARTLERARRFAETYSIPFSKWAIQHNAAIIKEEEDKRFLETLNTILDKYCIGPKDPGEESAFSVLREHNSVEANVSKHPATPKPMTCGECPHRKDLNSDCYIGCYLDTAEELADPKIQHTPTSQCIKGITTALYMAEKFGTYRQPFGTSANPTDKPRRLPRAYRHPVYKMAPKINIDGDWTE